MAPATYKTKLVCTIGPLSESPETLRRMLHAGVTIVSRHGHACALRIGACQRTGRTGGQRVEVVIAEGDEYSPTPPVSHAIFAHNGGRKTGRADGVAIKRAPC